MAFCCDNAKISYAMSSESETPLPDRPYMGEWTPPEIIQASEKGDAVRLKQLLAAGRYAEAVDWYRQFG